MPVVGVGGGAIPGTVQVDLVGQDVHPHPEALERRADLGEHQRDARGGELGRRRVPREAYPARESEDTIALVALLSHRLATGASTQREAEALDLGPGVVAVVLAR